MGFSHSFLKYHKSHLFAVLFDFVYRIYSLPSNLYMFRLTNVQDLQEFLNEIKITRKTAYLLTKY